MRLALAMGRTVRELMASITSEELAEWQAFDLIEPIGGVRGDLQTGFLSALIANCNRDERRKPTPYLPDDFRIEYWRPKPTEEEIAAKIKLVMAAFRRKKAT